MSIQLTLEVQEVNAIIGALGKLPLEQSFEAFVKVRSQTEAQLAAQRQAAAPSADQAPPETKKPE